MKIYLRDFIVVALVGFIGSLHSEGIFFDWQLRLPQQTANVDNETNTTNDDWPDFIPLPFPSNYNSTHPYTRDLMDSRANAGKPTAVMLVNSSGPVYGTSDLKSSLADLLGYVKRLDYCFADFEGPLTRAERINETDRMWVIVRGQTNPKTKNAWIGNYGQYPGYPRTSRFYPDQDDNTTGDYDYRVSEMNVAQPPCYHLSAAITHTWSSAWGTNICPNERFSIFWRCLDEISVAARALPKDHKLLPWVNIYEYVSGYTPNDLPTREDHKMLIKHYRMRKADGIARLAINSGDSTTGIPAGSWILSYTGNQHRQDILDAWNSLDAYGAYGGFITSFMNLNTTKTTGIEWSGMRTRNAIRVLISNLSSTDQSVRYPAYWGNLPSVSPVVSRNSHREIAYEITNLNVNYDFNNAVSPWVLFGTGGRISTGGFSNGPCLKFSGSSWGAYYGNSQMATDANAKMKMTVSLSANVAGAQFFAQAYCLDKDSNYISGVLCPMAPRTNLTNSTTDYTFNFTVPDNDKIKYIQPILYNARYDTNTSDVIYLDNLNVKFQ